VSARPRILVVAGHDPSGGAGVDADREAAVYMGAEARCVVTAWTRQDGRRVAALGARDPADWLSEARAELAAEPPAALKSGLLPGASHVRALAVLIGELCGRSPDAPVVVDPVLAASSGEPFLDAAGIEALLLELAPLGVVLAPNLPEAARLAGVDLAALARDPRAGGDPDAGPRVRAAQALLARGAAAVVLKGGHGAEDPVLDLVLAAGAPPRWLGHARVAHAQSGGLRGTGCRFATALAAGLASGLPLAEAAARAGEWVAERIAAAARPLEGAPRPLPTPAPAPTLSPPDERL
jgi:hydroxymethylpyrimidine/phosphomethylpyrimidine kinase